MLAARQWQERVKVSRGLIESMNASPPAIKTTVLAVYMIAGPADCVPRLDRGGAGHDVAGAIALVVGEAQAFQAGEQVVAQIELNVA